MSNVLMYGTFVKYGKDIFRTTTYLQWGNSSDLIGACVTSNPGIAVLETRGLYIQGPVNDGKEFAGLIKLDDPMSQLVKVIEEIYQGEKLEGILYVYNIFTVLDASFNIFMGKDQAWKLHRNILLKNYSDFVLASNRLPWVMLAWGCDSRPAIYSEKLRWMNYIKKKDIPYIGIEAIEYPDYLQLRQQGDWRQKKYILDVVNIFKVKNISLKVISRIDGTSEELKGKGIQKIRTKRRLFEFITNNSEDLISNFSEKGCIKEIIKLIDERCYSKALDLCNKVISEDVKSLAAYIQKSYVLELMDNVEGAVKNIGEILVKTKDIRLQSLYDAKVAEYRGEEYKALNDYNNSIRIIRELENNSTENEEILKYLYSSIGKLLCKLNRNEEALSYFEEALSIHDTADILDNRQAILDKIKLLQQQVQRVGMNTDKFSQNNNGVDSNKKGEVNEKNLSEICESKINIEEVMNTDWEELKKEMDSLIGLNNVKRELYSIMNYLHYERKRSKALNLLEQNLSYHFMFVGNPGTGKTTVARLLGKIMVQAGVLSKGHVVEVDRSKIVGQYVGQTAVLTKKAIESAMDGILFIDEAYSLYRSDNANDYGVEAIDTLVKAMEDFRGNFVVIFAGYSKEINKLMQLNPGLRSRINVELQFEDYQDDELLDIGKKIAGERHYELDEEAQYAFLEKVFKLKIDKSFANGRTVRNIIEDAIREKAYRIGNNTVPENELRKLSAIDFGEVTGLASNRKSIDESLKEFNKLIGLSEVKVMIKEIVDFIQLQNKRKEIGFKSEDIVTNMMFTGNPGTGKTTVARTISRLFKEMGILKKGQLVEVSREDLVGEYVGQTATKTMDKIKEAYGGVLFIDEAYSLAQGGENDYGKEAVATLIKEMEDNKDKLMVIMAGYTEEMSSLMTMNPGLRSRMGFNIEFPDYNYEELLEIFKMFCRDSDYIINEGAEKVLKNKFEELYINREKNFGNARMVRQMFEKVRMKQANRIMTDFSQGRDKNQLITIEAVDIE